jgi:hypothetical protein
MNADNQVNSMNLEQALEVFQSGEEGYFDEEGYWVDSPLVEEAISVLQSEAEPVSNGTCTYDNMWQFTNGKLAN